MKLRLPPVRTDACLIARVKMNNLHTVSEGCRRAIAAALLVVAALGRAKFEGTNRLPPEVFPVLGLAGH